MDYKDEFNYHAVVLIFGQNSPKIDMFKIFKFDVMRKYSDINFSEMSGLTPDNVPDINRKITLSPKRCFVANNCRLSSGVCRDINFVDSEHKIFTKDSLFTLGEYEYFSSNWDDTVVNKIRTLGMLIRSIYEGKLIEIPLLINEFPEVSKVLLEYPGIWITE